MRNVCSRFSPTSLCAKGKGALLTGFLVALFGMAAPSARALSTTNVLGFAKATDYVMESEGTATLMVVRKEGTRGALEVEVELQKDASTNSITGWPTTNPVVRLRDNQLSASMVITVKDNSNTNSTPTNSFIKFKLVNPRVAPGEDPILTPTIATAFANHTLNLVNDDNALTFSFARINNLAPEGTNMTITVRLPQSPSASGLMGVAVDYIVGEIAPGDLAPGATIASDGADFTGASGTLMFGDNDTTQNISFDIAADSEVEFPEEFVVVLSNAAGGTSLPTPAYARIRIINDAGATNAPVTAGSVDRTFNPENTPPFRLRNPGANGPVADVVVDDNNNTYLAGAFTSVNSNPRGGIARLNEWGQIDQSFAPSGANGAVSAVELYETGPQAGKVVIGGSFNAVNGQQYNSVARLNDDGSIDTSFKIGLGADGPVYALGLPVEGGLVVGGAFDNINGIARGGIAVLRDDGSVDTSTFQGVNVDGPVFSVLVEQQVIAPEIVSGTLINDTNEVTETLTLPTRSGSLIILYATYNESDHIQVYRGNTLLEDQIVDAGFQLVTDPTSGQVTTNWGVGAITLDLGPYGTAPSTIRVVVNSGGSPGTDLDYAIRLDAIGTKSILIGGDFQNVNGIPHGGIARFSAGGVLDTNFTANIGSAAEASVNSLAQQANGGIIVGGSFERFNNVVRGGLTRLNPNGTQDLTFASGTGADQTVHSVLIDDFDDTIYVAGEFTLFNGTPRNFLARLNPDGSLDTSFMDSAYNQFAGFPNTTGLAADGPMGYLATVDVTPDGDVVVGGLFAQVGGGASRTNIHPRQNIARLVGGSTVGPGNFQIAAAEIPWDENGGPAPITFERTGGNLGSARGFITTFDGAAVAGQDYAGTNAVYTLGPAGLDPTIGATTGNPLPVGIIDDTIIEGNEDFFVTILGVDGVINLGGEIIRPGVAFGTIPEAVVTIIENDTQPIFLGFAKPEFDVDEDDNLARIEVYRTGDPNQLVTVDFLVRADTGPFAATAGTDFRTVTNTITFQPGQTNAFFTVTILDDELTENDETVSLRLSRPNFGARLDTNAISARLNIIDNDLASGKLDFTQSTYQVIEGQPFVEVQVRRAGGNIGLISVDYSTANGTALAGEDYTATSGRLTWNNQDISMKTIRVPISDNDIVETDEQFSLQLSNPSVPGIIGNLHANPVVTIKDNDRYGEISFSISDFYTDEDGANAVIQVVRRNGSADTVTVNYATSAGTAVPANDYTNVSGTLTFAPGETAQTFVVPIADDQIADTNRTVTLTLSSPVKATLGAQSTATLTILDNETLDIPAGDVEKDFAIGTGANGRVNALWIQNDGPTNTLRKIILAGDFTDYDRSPRQHVARVNDDGLIDARYANGLTIDGSVRTILGTPDGKLVIGGDFSSVDDVPARHIARLNAVGRRDTLFDIGSGTDGTVNALAQTFVGTNRESRIVIGGAFTVFNGVARPRIVLVGEDAKVDMNFDPGVGPDLAVTAVAAQRDGKIIIGGLFNKVSGDPRRGIARLNLDGKIDTTFAATSIAGTVRSIVIQADDKILIGGDIVSVNGVSRPGIARLNVDGSLDESFDPGSGANGGVLSLALQPDGKIIAGGNFTTFDGIGRPRITRLLTNGDNDLNINFGTGANDTIAAVASQFDRKIVLGGDFTEVNGFPRNRFARLFGGSVIGAGRVEFFLSEYRVGENDGLVRLVVKRSGGTDSTATASFVFSDETATSGSDYRGTNGTITFGPGESAQEIVLRILDDNLAEEIETALVTLTDVTGASIGRQPLARVEIVSDDAVFSFSQPDYFVNEGIAGGSATIRVIREGDLTFPVTVTVATADGTATSPADYSAGTSQLIFTPGETIKTLLIPIVDDNQGEGNETVELSLQVSGGSALPGLANAILVIEDNDFHPGFLTFTGPEIFVSETNKIVTLAVVRTSGTQGPASVRVDSVQLTASEGTDYIGIHTNLTFTDGQGTNFIQLQIENDETVEATELFELRLSNATGGALGNNSALTVGIADDDTGPGSLDMTFNTGAGPDGVIYAMDLQPDGKVVIGGVFENVNDTNANHVARLLPNGLLDGSFSIGVGPDNIVRGVALDRDGNISIGGAFRTFNAIDMLYFARVTTNGFLDSSMTGRPGLNATVLDVTAQPDGQTLIGGQFTAPVAYLGRVSGSGQMDVSFNPATGANGEVVDIQRASDGKVVVGGDFTTMGGQPRGRVARLLSDGRLDLEFNTSVGANDTVRAVFPLPGGQILIGGDFTQVNGQNVPYLARLNADGSVDPLFGGDAFDGRVNAIDVYPDGRIVVGGEFSSVGAAFRKGLVRLTKDGKLDPTFEVAVDVDGYVYDVEVQPDGNILLAGDFAHVNGFPIRYIARINGASPAPRILSTAISAGNIVITFESEAGETYEVLGSEDLSTWVVVDSVDASGDTTQSFIETTGNYRFFIIRKVSP
jgi:uncharacterized delta-60 repeat protein